MNDVLLTTDLDLERVHRGKVRDIYALGDRLLFVATDRLSAFDVVFNEGIPNKGHVLTHVSKFWVDTLGACRPYHLVTDDLDAMGLEDPSPELRGRTMLVEKLDMLPVECVVRGTLVGSGWKDYQATGRVCGHVLPAGLRNGDRLPDPIFTPATKASVGSHDENIDFDRVVALIGAEHAEELRARALAIFREASARAQRQGLVLVDTKLEFGRRKDGTLVLADEVLTPDASRYWVATEAQATAPGETPPSFDKQIVRNYLETLDWNKQPPPPQLPAQILERTGARYLELVERLTGAPLPE